MKNDVLNDELLDILRDRKIDEKLFESRQLDREKERDALLQRLRIEEPDDEKQGKQLALRRTDTMNRLRAAEAAAATARRELCEIDAAWSLVGNQAERVRGELRKLSDPRINDAHRALLGFSDRVRMAFKSGQRLMRSGVMGDKIPVDVGNSIEVGEALATIRAATERLNILQMQTRPADLPAVIEEIISPCRNMARTLVGL